MGLRLAQGSPQGVVTPGAFLPSQTSYTSYFTPARCQLDPQFVQLLRVSLSVLGGLCATRLGSAGQAPHAVRRLVQKGFSIDTVRDVRFLVKQYRKDKVVVNQPTKAEIVFFAGALCSLYDEGAAVCLADIGARGIEARRVDRIPLIEKGGKAFDFFLALARFLKDRTHGAVFADDFKVLPHAAESLTARTALLFQEEFGRACISHPKDTELLRQIESARSFNAKSNIVVVVNGKAQQIFVTTLIRQCFKDFQVEVGISHAHSHANAPRTARISVVTSGIQKEPRDVKPSLVIAMSPLPQRFPDFAGARRMVLTTSPIAPFTEPFLA